MTEQKPIIPVEYLFSHIESESRKLSKYLKRWEGFAPTAPKKETQIVIGVHLEEMIKAYYEIWRTQGECQGFDWSVLNTGLNGLIEEGERERIKS